MQVRTRIHRAHPEPSTPWAGLEVAPSLSPSFINTDDSAVYAPKSYAHIRLVHKLTVLKSQRSLL